MNLTAAGSTGIAVITCAAGSPDTPGTASGPSLGPVGLELQPAMRAAEKTSAIATSLTSALLLRCWLMTTGVPNRSTDLHGCTGAQLDAGYSCSSAYARCVFPHDRRRQRYRGLCRPRPCPQPRRRRRSHRTKPNAGGERHDPPGESNREPAGYRGFQRRAAPAGRPAPSRGSSVNSSRLKSTRSRIKNLLIHTTPNAVRLVRLMTNGCGSHCRATNQTATVESAKPKKARVQNGTTSRMKWFFPRFCQTQYRQRR